MKWEELKEAEKKYKERYMFYWDANAMGFNSSSGS